MTWLFSIAHDIGGRSEQQDRVAAISMRGGSEHLLVLADGMGGHRGGAQAAQQLLDSARTYSNNSDAFAPDALLESICLHTHQAISQWGGVGQRRPGTTCVLLYVSGPEAYWVHVGDSRLYFARSGQLIRQTLDHSLDALESTHGRDAVTSRNLIYMCLGGSMRPRPCADALAVEAGDVILVCSDGFWEQVAAEEALGHIQQHGLAANSASELVQLARRRGGSGADNISLAMARWQGEIPTEGRGWFGRRRRH